MAHPVSLRLLQYLSNTKEVPECLRSRPIATAVEGEQVEAGNQEYITPDMLAGIAEMVLVKKGRLSVQPVTPIVYDAVRLMGTLGGWEDWFKTVPKAAPVKRVKKEVIDGDGEAGEDEEGGKKKKVKLSAKKGKSKQVDSAGEEDELLSDLLSAEEEADVKPRAKAAPKPRNISGKNKVSPKKEVGQFREDSEEVHSEEEVIRTTAGGRAARNSARNGIF